MCPILTPANEVLTGLRFDAAVDRLKELSKAREYAAAIALIDELLASDLPNPYRQKMAQNRKQLIGFQTISAAIDAANGGDWQKAREALEALLAENPDANIAREAKRVLEDINTPVPKRGSAAPLR